MYLICKCGNWDLDLEVKTGKVICPKCGKTGHSSEFKEEIKEEEEEESDE